MTHSKQPKLSIVIAAWNNVSYLKNCLASLEKQARAEEIEVFVISNYDGGNEEMKRQFSFARFVRLDDAATVPELRAQGVLHSNGKIIALLEDHCVFDENWRAEIEKAHELQYAVIGGAIENGDHQKVLDWAVYFYDYGKYMLPDTARVVTTLSGANVSYKREALEELSNFYSEGFYENFVHDELQRRGHTLYLMPSAIVYHKKNYSSNDALTQAFHHARAFAAKRISDASPFNRIIFAMKSLALPILLPTRIALEIFRKGRHRKELLKSLPYLLLLLTGWSFGEFCGYLFGAGDSAGQWK